VQLKLFTVYRALRVLAYVHRFFHRCQKYSPPSEVRLEAQEVSAAKQLMTICAQHRYIADEYRCLSQTRPVSAKGLIVFTLTQPLHIHTLTHTYVCTYIVARAFFVVGQLYKKSH